MCKFSVPTDLNFGQFGDYYSWYFSPHGTFFALKPFLDNLSRPFFHFVGGFNPYGIYIYDLYSVPLTSYIVSQSRAAYLVLKKTIFWSQRKKLNKIKTWIYIKYIFKYSKVRQTIYKYKTILLSISNRSLSRSIYNDNFLYL